MFFAVSVVSDVWRMLCPVFMKYTMCVPACCVCCDRRMQLICSLAVRRSLCLMFQHPYQCQHVINTHVSIIIQHVTRTAFFNKMKTLFSHGREVADKILPKQFSKPHVLSHVLCVTPYCKWKSWCSTHVHLLINTIGCNYYTSMYQSVKHAAITPIYVALLFIL